ncbi:MAG: NADH-quinone oxidoreductase subunit NuoE [Anaerolineales bacterium]|nr:NADH-quinone oxidoreductase subunit NuoE [Anaerolineales bacterium]
MERSTSQDQFVEDTQGIGKALSEIQTEFEGRPDELIPMLQRAQRAIGYLPERALLEISRLTRLPAATVFGVVTFYEQFRLHPVGKHIIRICRGTACHVRGSDRILRDIQTRFNIAPGETTKDRQFTLETVACFGSCALAPVVVIDGSVKGRIDTSKARKILEEIQEKSQGPSVNRSMTKK